VSPATEQVPSGVESTDLDANSANTSSTTEVHMLSEDTLPDEESENPLPSPAEVQHRRELLTKTLADHKQKKLKRKLPLDAQLLMHGGNG